MKKEGISIHQWWQVYSDIGSICMDHVQFAKVLACEGRYDECQQELANLTRQSVTGKRIFGDASRFLIGMSIAKFCKEKLKPLSSMKAVEEQHMAKVTSACLQEALVQNCATHLTMKREIHLEYAGIALSLQVTTFPEELWACLCQNVNV